VRAMQTEDIPAAIALWRATEGVGRSPEETPAMLTAFLERNHGLSSAALDADGTLVGAVLGGQDGRRGYLYHLAMHRAYRGRGLGRALVDRTTAQLAACGIVKATIMVFAANAEGYAFWQHLGWKVRGDLEPMQINL